MKRLLLVIGICSVALGAFAQTGEREPGLYIIPSANADVGINDYLRGGCAGFMLQYDLGFLVTGLQVYGDYDITFGVANVPALFILGFNRNFWLGIGYTVGLGAMKLADGSGSYGWAFGDLPNTFLVGLNLYRLKLGFADLVIPTTISFTMNGPTNSEDPAVIALGGLIGILAGLKATAGIGLEFKAF